MFLLSQLNRRKKYCGIIAVPTNNKLNTKINYLSGNSIILNKGGLSSCNQHQFNNSIVCGSFNYIVPNYFTKNAWSYQGCNLNEIIKLGNNLKQIDGKSAVKFNIFLNHLMFPLVDYAVTDSGNPPTKINYSNINSLAVYRVIEVGKHWDKINFVLICISIIFNAMTLFFLFK